MTSEPYLSVVVTARNDDHGGDPRYRMQLFVDSLLEQCERLRLPAELIIVEWNPPLDRPRLADVLSWPATAGWCAVRVVEVPHDLHATLDHSATLPLFQMIAKNVGIRRAAGRFVLATNIDILFDDSLMHMIARRGLGPGVLYRVDRYDVPERLAEPFSRRLTWARDSVIRIHTARGSVDIRTGDFYPIGNESALVHKLRRILLRRPALVLALRDADAWLINLMLPLRRRVANGGGTAQREGDRVADTVLAIATAALLVADSAQAMLGGALKLARDVTWLVRRYAYWFWCGIREPRKVPGRVGRRLRQMWRGLTTVRPSSGREQANRTAGGATADHRLNTLHAWRVRRQTPVLHTNACGDFTLMAREDWLRTSAYPELQQFSMHIDGLFLFQAYYAGIAQEVLPQPIFHLEHGAGFRPDKSSVEELETRLARARIPQITQKQFDDWLTTMRVQRRPIRFNDDEWGFAGVELAECDPVARALEVAS